MLKEYEPGVVPGAGVNVTDPDELLLPVHAGKAVTEMLPGLVCTIVNWIESLQPSGEVYLSLIILVLETPV
jgi:hypothetical protein